MAIIQYKVPFKISLPGRNHRPNSIDFALVMHIFYPFSLQTHVYTFPGESHRDCPRDANERRLVKIRMVVLKSNLLPLLWHFLFDTKFYFTFSKNCTSILVPRDAYHEWGKNNTEIQKTAE